MTTEFSPSQRAELKSLMREAVKEELSDAGLRIDDGEQQDEAREDFRFLRRLRLFRDQAAERIGNAIIMSVIVIIATLIGLGANNWLGKH